MSATSTMGPFELGDSLYLQRMRIFTRAIENNEVALVKSLIQNQNLDPNVRCPKITKAPTGVTISENELPLEIAISNNSLDMIKMLVNDFSTNPNVATNKEKTILMKAIDTRNVPLIKCLFEGKIPADPNLPGQYQTPLELAVLNGDYEAVNFLLSHSADINFADDTNLTALGTAAKEGDKEMVSYLMSRGAEPASLDYKTNTLLQIMTKFNLPQALEILIECGIDMSQNCCESAKHTHMPKLLCRINTIYDLIPLHVAILRGNERMTRLLASEENVDQRTSCGYTALHLACCVGRIKTVNVLLSLRDNEGRCICRLDLRDRAGDTPIHIAVKHEHQEIVARLLQMGANVNLLDSEGATVLHYAALHHNKTMFELLLRRSLGLVNREVEFIHPCQQKYLDCNVTPLTVAAVSDNYKICKILIEEGAGFVNSKGKNILHSAAKHGSAAVVNLFLDQGCDINVEAEDKSTPLIYAAASGNHSTSSLLIEKGALLNSRDRDDMSALSHSILCAHGNSSVKCFSGITTDLLAHGSGCLNCRLPYWNQYILESLERPLSLKHQSRIALRQHLAGEAQGRSIEPLVMHTALPPPLKNHLMFKQEIDEYLFDD